MRVLSIPLLGLLVLVGLPAIAAAQDAAADKRDAPQALTGAGGADAGGASDRDKALDPSTLPKARQTVVEHPAAAAPVAGTPRQEAQTAGKDAANLDPLSPDETRRARRAAERAAAKTAPHVAAAPTVASPPPAKTAAPAASKAAEAAAPPRDAARSRAARSARLAAARRARAAMAANDRNRRPRRYLQQEAGPGPRYPRVGDVIPPDVPLFPLPPPEDRPGRPFPPGAPPFPGQMEQDAY